MDLKAGADNNNRDENDNGACDRSNNNSNTEPVRNVRQFLRSVIDAMNVVQSSDANAMLVPPEADSPLHILTAFSNELLYEVFMQLHFLDLLNVAKVCTQFQGQAHAAFASKYKNLVLDRVECDQEKMESILCEFGSSIRSLRVYSKSSAKADADGALFRAIIQNCTTELTMLKLFNVNLQVESPQFRLPFPKLEELELRHCEGNIDLAHLIDDCPELKIVSIASESLKGVNGLIDHKFEKLESMNLYEFHGDIDDDVFERFITLNPQLLHLFVLQFFTLNTSHAIRLIAQNLLKLETLRLEMDIAEPDQSDFECLSQLRSLTYLLLRYSGINVTPLAQALAKNDSQINTWFIYGEPIDDIAIRYISQLKQLDTLNLNHINGLNDEQLLGLVRNLPNLELLSISPLFDSVTINGLVQMVRHAINLIEFELTRLDSSTELVINTVDYNMILNIIRERSGSLYMGIRGQNIKLNVPEEILEENDDTLYIYCSS